MSRNPSWPSVGAFLKEHRQLIPRETAALGPYLRQPGRRGKPITQEEIAEAIGVSRVWYAMLESGAGLRTSPRLVARLADALALTDEDRDTLLRLGVPELSGRSSSLSLKDLSAIASLRRAARRVWSATSESEILHILVEVVANQFRDFDCAGALVRLKPGQWVHPVNFHSKRSQMPIHDMYTELYDGLIEGQIDELNFHDILNDPGQIGARFELFASLSPNMKNRFEKAYANAGLEATNFLKARVKSRGGFEATLSVAYGYGCKTFSELDRALMGGLADLASLAASR